VKNIPYSVAELCSFCLVTAALADGDLSLNWWQCSGENKIRYSGSWKRKMKCIRWKDYRIGTARCATSAE